MHRLQNPPDRSDQFHGTILQDRPADPEQLHSFITTYLKTNVPTTAITPGNTPPFNYILHTFFEGRCPGGRCDVPDSRITTDAVVWAARGAGKTRLGAVATALDLIFKPGIRIKILGGSFQQSSRMYEHLLDIFSQNQVATLLEQPPTRQKFTLVNNSEVEILAQSHTAVRGARVHKLRCDEVDEFQPDIWQAAQLVTVSQQLGDYYVNGAIDALSTMHKYTGIMSKLTSIPHKIDDHEPLTRLCENTDNNNRRSRRINIPAIFKWNALDVMQTCPDERPCNNCPLHQFCLGRAKFAKGFIPVNDVINQYHRTDPQTFLAEMICSSPRQTHAVYPNFKHEIHVRQFDIDFNHYRMLAAMDFGLRSPNVMLWAAVVGNNEKAFVYVIHELAQTDITLSQCIEQIEQYATTHKLPRPDWIAVDPAGTQRNQHTGLTDVDILKEHGYHVKYKRQPISIGLSAIRRRLQHQSIIIHPRCTKLINAVKNYHFNPNNPNDETPVKDGPDHFCDTLRYLINNIENTWSNCIFSNYL